MCGEYGYTITVQGDRGSIIKKKKGNGPNRQAELYVHRSARYFLLPLGEWRGGGRRGWGWGVGVLTDSDSDSLEKVSQIWPTVFSSMPLFRLLLVVIVKMKPMNVKN